MVKEVITNLNQAPEANIGQTMSPLLKSNISRKPKPMHIVKKRGIVPDGLVQARLTQFRLLTNQGRGNEREAKWIVFQPMGEQERERPSCWIRQQLSNRGNINFVHENLILSLLYKFVCSSILSEHQYPLRREHKF